MHKWQRIALGVAALFAWLVLEAVSISANWRFAWTLGSSDFEKYILGFGSVASDLLKAFGPVAFLYFLAIKRKLPMIATAVVWVVAVAFSLMSATGFVAEEKYRAYYTASSAQKATADARKDVEKEAANRDWLPTHEPLPVLEAKRAAAIEDRRWRMSDGCTTAKGEVEAWCRDVRQLGVQIVAAQAAAESDAKIAEKRVEIAKGRDYGDAQISFVAHFTGLSEEHVLYATIILMVLLIELGSSLGLTIALGLLTDENTAVGRVVSQALSVVRAKPRVPEAAAVAPAIPQAVNFAEPVAVKPEGGGLRAKLRPVLSMPQAKKMAG